MGRPADCDLCGFDCLVNLGAGTRDKKDVLLLNMLGLASPSAWPPRLVCTAITVLAGTPKPCLNERASVRLQGLDRFP